MHFVSTIINCKATDYQGDQENAVVLRPDSQVTKFSEEEAKKLQVMETLK